MKTLVNIIAILIIVATFTSCGAPRRQYGQAPGQFGCDQRQEGPVCNDNRRHEVIATNTPRRTLSKEDACVPSITEASQVQRSDGSHQARVRVGEKFFRANPNLLAVTNNRTGVVTYMTPEQLRSFRDAEAKNGHGNSVKVDGTHPAFRDLNKNPLNPFNFN